MSTQSVPPVVYHYTSLAAMMSILRTQTIWASDIAYLNDVSERQLLLNIIDEALPAFALERDLDTMPLNQVRTLNVSSGPFVASFSAERDALNQWRSYCPHANGVSIGFKSECLQSALLTWKPPSPGVDRGPFDHLPDCDFRAVSYIEPLQDGIAESALEWAYASAKSLAWDLERQYPDQGATAINPYFRHFIEAEASFYKHKGFESEREFRLLLPDLYMQTHLTEFRCTRSSMVPYVSLSVPHSSKAELIRPEVFRWDAVSEIVVGPTPNIALTKDAVWRFLHSIGLASAHLSESTLPYREW